MKLCRFMPLCRRCKLVVSVSGLSVVLSMTLQATAQSVLRGQSQITQAIDPTNTVHIPGSVYPAVARSKDLGEVRPGLELQRMVLVLKPSAERAAALTQLLDDQQNVNSSNYHQWLTPQQFGQQYGPAASDVAQVQGWLQSQGFHVDRAANGGWWVQFSGTAQQVSRAFGTSIHSYSLNGEVHTANATSISIPAALSPVVSGVLSLHNFPKIPNHTAVQRVVRSSSGQLVPVQGKAASGAHPDGTFGGGTHYIAPGDMAAIYDTNPLLKQGTNGAGVVIAVIGQTDVQMADIESFRSIFNLPANDPQVVVDGTDPGFSNGDEEESDLDLEYAGALAPQAKILFVTSGSTLTTSGIDLSSAYAVDNALAPILTLSYGECEANLNTAGNAYEKQLWEQAAAEGITVFVSSGDSGSANCDAGGQQYDAVYGLMVNGLASTPYNVAVGGTTLVEGANTSTYWGTQNTAGYASAVGYIPETVWNDSCDTSSYPAGCAYTGGQALLAAAGGGVSGCLSSTSGIAGYSCTGSYTKPAWQAGTGVPADGRRDLPDLVLAASADHDGYLICNEGSCQTAYQNGTLTIESASIIGGTSAAAPSMAGIMALVEQKNGSYQGQADYVFYKLAATQNTASCNSSNLTSPTPASTCVFHDVTTGTNAQPCYGSSPNCSSMLNGVSGLLTGYSAGTGYDAASGLGSVDANNLATAWGTTSLAASVTRLMLGSVSAVHGQPVSVSAAVQPVTGTGTPTGDLSLSAGGQDFGPYTLAAGSYSGTVSALPGGTYGVAAHYAGDATYAASASSSASITITPETSNVGLKLYYFNYQTNSVSLASGSIEFGAPLYYQATVQGSSGQGVPTGSVNFTQDGAPLGSYTLNSSGQTAVDFSLVSLPNVLPGTHAVIASYAGDNSFQTATSASVPLTISQGQVFTFAIPNVNSVVQGQPVEINLSLGQGYATQPLPTGTMQLYDNGTALGQPLTVTSNGVQGNGYAQAVYNTSSLAVGTHVLTASYSGDKYYAAVSQTSSGAISSTIVVKTVTTAASTVTISGSASMLSVGQSVQYAVHVVPTVAGGPVPTGTVTLSDPTPSYPFTFSIDAATALTNGAVTFINTFYGSGSLQVYATYSGDSNYAPSVSPVILTVYNTIAATGQLSANAAYTLPGSQSSITVQITGKPNMPAYPVPTGAVQFYDSLNGATAKLIGTQYLSTGNGNVGVDTLPVLLATGTHSISAQYAGDSVWSALALAPVTVVVTQPDFNLTAPNGATPVTLGTTAAATITATPELTYSGTVTFACTGGIPLGASCSFTPSSVTTSGVSASTVLNLSTVAPSVQTGSLLVPPRPGVDVRATVRFAGCAGLAVLLLLSWFGRRPKLRLYSALLLCFVFGVAGCSGGSSSSAPSTFSLRSDFGTKAAMGSNVSFTVTVPGSNAGGSVMFTDGTTSLGSVAVNNNKANLQTTSLTLGTHPITAVYQPATGSALTATLQQGITGTAVVQVTGLSGALSHTVNISYLLQ